jgi:hypothetical protein
MERSTWECTILAGFGGTMPTLSKFGAALVADPSSPMPALGFYVGLGIFFLIGSLMAYALAERNLKQALLAGIAAPAIIASTISGAAGAQPQALQQRAGAQSAPSKEASSLLDILVPTANAQDKKPDTKQILNAVPPKDRALPEGLKYKYSLASFPTGSSDWRTSDVNLRVTVKDQDGKLSQYNLPSAFTTLSFSSDKPISEVKLEADGFNSKFISIGVNTGGKILVTRHIETKKDFIWAFGGKGLPVVRDVNALVVPAERP